jgi:hypothetical protein
MITGQSVTVMKIRMRVADGMMTRGVTRKLLVEARMSVVQVRIMTAPERVKLPCDAQLEGPYYIAIMLICVQSLK